MILPDVNLLIHAFRSDTDDHHRARGWLDRVINGDSRYGMAPQVLSGVIRIVTHRRIFARPSALDEAFNFCEALLQPHCVVVRPGARHWEIFARLCREADARGNLVPDAWLAALAIESGCDWITLDRDYARFPGLHWRTPW
ncbi:MAG: type II toxin-antitoxin system VapC family toxin [Acidobacteriota bacterium]